MSSTSSVIPRVLPAESVEFECCDDADDGGEFRKASPIAGGHHFPVLKCEMHRSTADRRAEIVVLFALSPSDSSPPLGFLRGVVADVPW